MTRHRVPLHWLVPPAMLLVLAASACGSRADAAQETIVIRYSRFEQTTLTVPAGVPVTITLRNDDPIEHEWIVGGDDLHVGHRTGTEPFHDTRPTEVTIPALETRVTTVTFDEPGVYRYICHLPGHEEYGMTGTLRVID